MSQSPYVDLYAALWPLTQPERYAGQGELFNRDRGPEASPPASRTWPDPDDAADPGLQDESLPNRPRQRAFHEPDAPVDRQGMVGPDKLKTKPKDGDPFDWVARDDQHSWRPTTGLFPDRDSAYGALAQAKGERGYHTGHVVQAGDFWRVNVLYRYPHVQY